MAVALNERCRGNSRRGESHGGEAEQAWARLRSRLGDGAGTAGLWAGMGRAGPAAGTATRNRTAPAPVPLRLAVKDFATGPRGGRWERPATREARFPRHGWFNATAMAVVMCQDIADSLGQDIADNLPV